MNSGELNQTGPAGDRQTSGLSTVGCVLATWIGAQNLDYKAFMVKSAIISRNSEYTKNVEQMFDAVTLDMVQLIIENAGK